MIIKQVFLRLIFSVVIFNCLIHSKICGNSSFGCQEGSTCCRGIGGWRCCKGENSNCCADGISTCPNNTICNLKKNRCESKTMPFLAIKQEVKFEKMLECEAAQINFALPSLENIKNCLNKATESYPQIKGELQEVVKNYREGNYLNCFFKIRSIQGLGNEIYSSIIKCFL